MSSKKKTPTLNVDAYQAAERVIDKYDALLNNVGSARANFFRELMDDRRNVDAECGYPANVTIRQLHQFHRRNPYARRVNEVMASEAFQVPLRVFETDDPETETPFETSADELAKKVRGVRSWHKDSKGVSLRSIFKRAAVQAAIGHYSVILLGFDDGLPLSEPVKGVEERYSMPGVPDGKSAPDGWNDPYVGTTRETRKPTNNSFSPEGRYELVRNFRPRTRTFLALNEETGEDEEVELKVGEDDQPLPPEEQTDEPATTRDLIYVRVYPEIQAMVTRWEMNRTSPRFGQPVSYLIYTSDWTDPETATVTSGAPATSIDVHWTRVVHVPGRDVNPDECTSTPETIPVWNQLMNLDKILGASGEGYWKGAFTPLSIESLPSLGPNPKLNRADIRNQIENFENSLTRVISLMGVTVKPITIDVKDPTPHVMVNVEAICIKMSIPKRIFMGSERGELSSTQDEGDWNDKLSAFQDSYLIPYVVSPFYDRLILVGALPEPEEYVAEFEAVSAQSEREIAEVANLKTTAIAAAIAGNVFSVIPEQTYLTSFTKFMEDDEAEAALEQAAQQEKELMEEQKLMAEDNGFQMQPLEGFVDPDAPPPAFGKPGGGPPGGPGGKPPAPPGRGKPPAVPMTEDEGDE